MMLPYGRVPNPIAFDDGTAAPEMMLLPYGISDPATGSLMPSMSAGVFGYEGDDEARCRC